MSKKAPVRFWKTVGFTMFWLILGCNLFSTALGGLLKSNWVGEKAGLGVVQLMGMWVLSVISAMVVQIFMRQNFPKISFKMSFKSLLINFWIHLLILLIAFWKTGGVYSSVIGWNFIPLIQGHYMLPTIFIIPPISVLLFFVTFFAMERIYFLRVGMVKALQKVRNILSYMGVMIGLIWAMLLILSVVEGMVSWYLLVGRGWLILCYCVLRVVLLFGATLGVYRLVYKFRPELIKLNYDFYVISSAVLLNFLLAMISFTYFASAPFMEIVGFMGITYGLDYLVLLLFGEIAAVIIAVLIAKGWKSRDKIR